MRIKSFSDRLFNAVLIVFFLILSSIFLYPVVYTVSLSFCDAKLLGANNITLLPVGFTLQSYQYLLSDGRILRYYMNTILYAVSGTAVMLLFTSMIAYPLSIRTFSGKGWITIFLLITMFFSGGLIPTYLLIVRMKMINTLWVMILPGAIGAWNVIVYKTFFSQLPDSLVESARIDGANHMTVLFRIVIPLSKALLATMALFSLVGFWNDYLRALIYLQKTDLQPIQMLLRKLLVTLDYKDTQFISQADRLALTSSRTVKCAAVIITITPIMCVYPFLQKYFAKGILVGSIKG
jgi:putative aldouronate transport system permease protein